MCGVTSAPYGTGAAAAFKDLKTPVAGKTGSTFSDQDFNFVGYTPYYVAGIWTGYDEITDQEILSERGAGIMPMNFTNQHFHLDIWRDVMEEIQKEQNLPDKSFSFQIIAAPGSASLVQSKSLTITPAPKYIETARDFLKEIPPIIDQYNNGFTIGYYKQYGTVPITKDQLKLFDFENWIPVDEPNEAIREEKISDINDIVSEGIYVLVICDEINYLLLSNDCKTAWMETIVQNKGYPRSLEYQVPDETAKNIKALYGKMVITPTPDASPAASEAARVTSSDNGMNQDVTLFADGVFRAGGESWKKGQEIAFTVESSNVFDAEIGITAVPADGGYDKVFSKTVNINPKSQVVSIIVPDDGIYGIYYKNCTSGQVSFNIKMSKALQSPLA